MTEATFTTIGPTPIIRIRLHTEMDVIRAIRETTNKEILTLNGGDGSVDNTFHVSESKFSLYCHSRNVDFSYV